jgi:hypothetical protein
LLRNRVTNISQHDGEVGIDLFAQISYEDVLVAAWNVQLLLRGWSDRATLSVELLWCWANIVLSFELLNVRVVGEVIVQFRVDDGFDQDSSLFSQLNENLND